MNPKKIIIAVGARPNFMKSAALWEEFKKHKEFQVILLHTGQHYDSTMSDSFFKVFNLPEPDIYLGVGSGSHAEQTGKIMIEAEKVFMSEKPDLVIVVGDVNSTVACALVAKKLLIPVAHVEAGLRSFDRTMPEEINRLLTDQLSDYLFTTCKDANLNLKNEGIDKSKIFFVGNVMIDTLLKHIEIAKKSDITKRLGLWDNGQIEKYSLLTLHRPSNVDDPKILKGIMNALLDFSRQIPVIFPVHPRTLKRLREFGILAMIDYGEEISSKLRHREGHKIIGFPPLGYLDFLCLMSNATFVLTDSGGIQEETTILGIPCLTIRNNTERPITVSEGTNIVIGNNPDIIKRNMLKVLKDTLQRKRAPKFWDGKAAERIIKVLTREIN